MSIHKKILEKSNDSKTPMTSYYTNSTVPNNEIMSNLDLNQDTLNSIPSSKSTISAICCLKNF